MRATLPGGHGMPTILPAIALAASSEVVEEHITLQLFARMTFLKRVSFAILSIEQALFWSRSIDHARMQLCCSTAPMHILHCQVLLDNRDAFRLRHPRSPGQYTSYSNPS